MLAAARRYGMVSFPLAPRFPDLLRELAAGNPVIVLQDLGIWPFERWHYAVAIGYDLEAGDLVLRSGEKHRQVLPLPVHELAWKRGDYWAMVVLPPERVAATAEEPGWLAAVAAFERVDPRGARAAYSTMLERWPASATAAIGLGNAHYRLGELGAAEAALRAALAREPGSVVALNNLAQTLSDQGRHEEALPIIERAVAAGGPFAKAAQETRALILGRIAKRPAAR
jgi:tetratricopeptide (TPR) repeat protein